MVAVSDAPAHADLLGRNREFSRITDVVFGRGGSQCVAFLRGDPGVGKTFLLDAADDLAVASGIRVLRASGVENETAMVFSSLHQLLYPVLDLSGQLGARERAAILAALDGGGPVDSQLTGIAAAALDLVSLAAKSQPLLLVLDDVQWFDQASAEVLAFVVRRLRGIDAATLICARSGADTAFDSSRLPEIDVRPLEADDANLLLTRISPQLESGVRERVLAGADGNPLALEELARASVDNEAAVTELSIELPLSRRLERIYAARVDELSEQVRGELLRAALSGQIGWGSSENRPAAGLYTPHHAEEAVALGLLVGEPSGLGYRFRHPLVRSAIVQASTGAERRAAHADLALVSAAYPERRAWHLAGAATEPDESVALALVEAARLVTMRGGASSAVSALTRAAELSPNIMDRSRRLADAAYIAGQSAQLEVSAHLLEESRRGPVDDADPYAATVSEMYILLYRNGEVNDAHRGLLRVLRTAPTDSASTEALQRALNVLITFSLFSGDARVWASTDSEIERFGPRVDAVTHVYRDAWGDVARSGHSVRFRLAENFDDVEANREPWSAMRYAVAAFYVDAVADYRNYVHRIVDHEGAAGAITNVMVGLEVLALDYIAMGELDSADATARRGLGLAETHGYALFAHQFTGYLGMTAALRGHSVEADRHRAAVDRWGRERSVGLLTQYASLIGTANALAQGDWEGAYRHATSVTTPGTFTPHSEQAPRMLLDLVEAAVLSGRKEEARAHALAARDARFELISPRYELMTLGALAFSAENVSVSEHSAVRRDQGSTRSLYEQALAVEGASEFAFDYARVRLNYGGWLRRNRELTRARDELARALAAFELVGAEPWAERARQELRAAGVAATQLPETDRASRTGPRATTLSPQEIEIARLAAQGLTNKQIGAQLFLSARTVSSHLYKIFPKLGIVSRSSLRDALEQERPDAVPESSGAVIDQSGD
ncbi:MAG: AAA family ATPase [Rhodoglobus sp.]